MPSANKNEKMKGTSAPATSRRSSGQAKTAVARTPVVGSEAGKAQTAATAKKAVSSVAKSADKPTGATAKSAGAVPPARKSAAKTAKTAAKTTTKAPVTPAPETVTSKTPAPKTPAPKGAETAALVKSPAELAAKAGAKPTKSPTGSEAAPATETVGRSTAGKPVATAKPSAGKPDTPATQKPAPVEATRAKPAPTAKAPAAAIKARGASPFPAAAHAPAGKISSTSIAGEDKKLAKRNEPSVMTAPVAAEKTMNETKAPARPAPAPAKAKPAGQKHGFKLNEFIVYPAHGVGQIIGMETQEVAGFSLELFVVSFIKDKMILKVPTSKVGNVGMRKLAEGNVVEKALSTLSGRARIKRTMWSRRAQEYEAKINSGDLVTIAEVVRDLYRSDTQPEQSYSERQLYEAALDRMAREVAAVRKLIDSEALKLIESFLQKGPRRGQKSETDVADEADEEDVDRAA